MTEDTINTAALLLELPEGAVPEHGITLLSYLAEDGLRDYGWVTHGDPYLEQTLGLMTLAQHDMIRMASEDDE